MKLQQPILLLSLSLATALTLLSDASPAASHPNTRATNVNLARQQQPQQPRVSSDHSTRPSRLGSTSGSGSAASQMKGNVASTLMRQDIDNIPRSRLPRRRQGLTSLSRAKPVDAQGVQVSKIAANNAHNKNPSKRNAQSAATLSSTAPPTSSSSSSSLSSSSTKRGFSLHKRAPPAKVIIPKATRNPSEAPSPNHPSSAKRVESSTSIPNTPLLLLPDSRSVWHTGSYQTVQWSRKYAKSLPKDTTVDIVLVDANTNRKIYSLKRFIPFRKGAAQVWVPAKMPEGVSFVLVLELYRGRSQEPVTSTVSSTSTTASSSQEEETIADGRGGQESSMASATTTNAFSKVVRRSDINISSGSRKVARDAASQENINRNGGNSYGVTADDKDLRQDTNKNDYYSSPVEERPYEFQPEENREEFPNTVRPLELEHTFGLHQKVYTLTPYTLKWRLPSAVYEMLDYTEKRAKLLDDKTIDWSKYNTTFQAKILVELVKDQTMESVSVLARDVPAETRFQYLSIQDRVPQAFYRLRVQMVVVQVKLSPAALAAETSGQAGAGSSASGGVVGFLGSGKQSKAMEGWEFPEGGEVIDRYEAITRRFWVSQGAL
ncbi:hypothetical protein BGX28_006948 [Mortierella sp. GBA30]|nr:hypothetical protein BGX28_006948 [Mortierella sp. GBA30]